MNKSWGQVFRHYVRNGYDHGYAAWMADLYESKEQP